MERIFKFGRLLINLFLFIAIMCSLVVLLKTSILRDYFKEVDNNHP